MKKPTNVSRNTKVLPRRISTVSSTPVVVRLAVRSDLRALNDIYNHYVLHSTCTYQEEPEPITDRRQWFDHHKIKHPVTVAEVNDLVVGWGSLSPYHARSAYRRTVENSVYVHHQFHRRGIGSLLLNDLINRARTLGHHVIIAGIDADQDASVSLHHRFGFKKVGQLNQVGFKFNRWLDVIYMELIL
jgi:L-amino acid N-acyltransferase YncA